MFREEEFPPEGRYQLGKYIENDCREKVKRPDAFNDSKGVS
jgi:hypothetical protein